ncbi:MAG: energy transducer TonB, partial [Acetobacter sp.]
MQEYAQQRRDPMQKVIGIGGVALVSAVLGGIYLTWVDKEPVPVTRPPLKAEIIHPVKPPPPPP